MNRLRPIRIPLAPVTATVIAACRAGGSGSAASLAKASVSGPAAHTIDIARTTLDDVLVDARGLTLDQHDCEHKHFDIAHNYLRNGGMP